MTAQWSPVACVSSVCVCVLKRNLVGYAPPVKSKRCVIIMFPFFWGGGSCIKKNCSIDGKQEVGCTWCQYPAWPSWMMPGGNWKLYPIPVRQKLVMFSWFLPMEGPTWIEYALFQNPIKVILLWAGLISKGEQWTHEEGEMASQRARVRASDNFSRR